LIGVAGEDPRHRVEVQRRRDRAAERPVPAGAEVHRRPGAPAAFSTGSIRFAAAGQPVLVEDRRDRGAVRSVTVVTSGTAPAIVLPRALDRRPRLGG
jgi:hypothetical protein